MLSPFMEHLKKMGIAETRLPGLYSAFSNLHMELCMLDKAGIDKVKFNGLSQILDIFSITEEVKYFNMANCIIYWKVTQIIICQLF